MTYSRIERPTRGLPPAFFPSGNHPGGAAGASQSGRLLCACPGDLRGPSRLRFFRSLRSPPPLLLSPPPREPLSSPFRVFLLSRLLLSISPAALRLPRRLSGFFVPSCLPRRLSGSSSLSGARPRHCCRPRPDSPCPKAPSRLLLFASSSLRVFFSSRLPLSLSPRAALRLHHSPLCWRSLATRAVHPVWWLAPRPAPSSPLKYSWKRTRSRQWGSDWNVSTPP